MSPKQHRKGFQYFSYPRSMDHLEALEQLHFFYGSAPTLQNALQAFQSEALLWQFAGAKGLAALGLGRVG